MKLLRIDPEITETRERRPSNTGTAAHTFPGRSSCGSTGPSSRTDSLGARPLSRGCLHVGDLCQSGGVAETVRIPCPRECGGTLKVRLDEVRTAEQGTVLRTPAAVECSTQGCGRWTVGEARKGLLDAGIRL